jgi:enoyl-CoA hydratase/carnithine racemase
MLVDRLADAPWRGAVSDAGYIEHCIEACGRPTLTDSALEAHRAPLETALPALPASLAETVSRLMALGGRDEWIDKGLAAMNGGCPTSVGIVHEQLVRVPVMSLADVFRMELNVANHCARNPDFAEGVRALIIDKDNIPAWRYGTLRELSHDYVLGHFASLWETHPLADLGEH